MVHTYGDIPDKVPNKNYFPLSKNIWRIHQSLGFDDYLEEKLEIIFRNFYDIVRVRLEEAILTSKDINAGKITNPDRIFTYFFFPPVLMIRNDLQVGTTKLLYGDSIDLSYIALNESTNEVAFVLNCHGEDGFPVDFWFVGSDDELLDRRHRKLGIKFRNLPQKMNSLTKIGLRAIDILKDIRNERTPQWSNSPYYTLVVWGLGITNAGLEISNFENIAYVYDGVNNTNYGFPEPNFTFAPFPAFLKMLFSMSRVDYTKKFAGLTSASKLFCHHLGEKGYPYPWFTDNLPEYYDIWVEYWTKIGIPFPSSSLKVGIPDFKKEIQRGTERFDFQYESGPRILLEDLELTLDEALSGVFIDVNHETQPQKLDSSAILSLGCGRDTKVLR